MGEFVPEENKIDVNANIEINITKNVFARICQILDENGTLIDSNQKNISVPYADYDNYDEIIRNTFFDEDKDMDFLSEDVKNKIVVLMILEYHSKAKINEKIELDNFDDIINAIINPALCKDKKLSILENDASGLVEYTLNF